MGEALKICKISDDGVSAVLTCTSEAEGNMLYRILRVQGTAPPASYYQHLLHQAVKSRLNSYHRSHTA